jgi:hypothetical protein
MIRELIEQAKTADKAGLIQILADLGVKADNRKGEDTLRAETLAGLEQALADEQKDIGSIGAGASPEDGDVLAAPASGEGSPSLDQAPNSEGEGSAPAAQPFIIDQASDQTFISAADLDQALVDALNVTGRIDPDLLRDEVPRSPSFVPPDLAEDEDPTEEEARPLNRLLRNTNTGAEFVWTTELAKLSHMVEV